MLGQDIGPYTDPITGYTVISDAQAYADASSSLVVARRYMDELVATIRAFENYFQEAIGAGYTVADTLFTVHAELLTEQQKAEQYQAALQDYVNRYRVQVLSSSGIAGLGVAPLVIVAAMGITLIASAIGYFLYRHYDIASATTQLQADALNYQRWLAQQVEAGLLDPQTAKELSDQSVRTVQGAGGWSLGSLFTGTAGIAIAVVAGLFLLSMARRS